MNKVAVGELATTGMYFSESLDCWVVEGYAEAVAVMREPALEIPRLALPARLLSDDQQAALMPLWNQAERLPLYSTGGEHQRLRRGLRAAFTKDAVHAWRPMIRRVAHELIDARWATGRVEVVDDVGRPLLRRVMAEVVGVPPRLRADFDRWARACMDVGKLATPDWSERVPAEARQASEAIAGMIHSLLRDPEDLPRGSLLANAAAGLDDARHLSEQEIAANARSLYTAGVHTTIFLVAAAACLMFADEVILRETRGSSGIVADVVRETLRYACPAVEVNVRRATRDVTIGAHSIRRGQFVRTVVLHASRDASRFPDPDTFDHHRRRRGATLAFGVGAHVCLGNHLATAIAEETCAALIDRRYSARLVAPHPTFHRRPAVPVMWGPDRVHLELGSVDETRVDSWSNESASPERGAPKGAQHVPRHQSPPLMHR